MKYSVYKLDFHTGLHVGKGKLSDGEMSIHADTMFSALCLEALKLGGSEMLENLVELAETDRIRISDGMPYIGETLYLPKPMIPVEGTNEGNSVEKKAYKKMKYLPVELLDSYLKGMLDVQTENRFFANNFGAFEIRTMVNLEDKEDAVPYSVGVFQYKKKSGMYFIIGSLSDKEEYFVGDLFDSLSYTGIGGKKSSGLGKFTLTRAKVPDVLAEGLSEQTQGQQFMALSVCLPEDGSMKKTLKNAHYGLVKRSGFISSETQIATCRKKKDLVVFSPGSCFCSRFKGVLSDVSTGDTHPVYSYGKSLLMRIN